MFEGRSPAASRARVDDRLRGRRRLDRRCASRCRCGPEHGRRRRPAGKDPHRRDEPPANGRQCRARQGLDLGYLGDMIRSTTSSCRAAAGPRQPRELPARRDDERDRPGTTRSGSPSAGRRHRAEGLAMARMSRRRARHLTCRRPSRRFRLARPQCLARHRHRRALSLAAPVLPGALPHRRRDQPGAVGDRQPPYTPVSMEQHRPLPSRSLRQLTSA